MMLDQQTLVFLGTLAVAGALLGGAVAHWRRGRAMIVTGAIIGMVAVPLIGAGLIAYSQIMTAIAIVSLLGLMVLGFLAS